MTISKCSLLLCTMEKPNSCIHFLAVSTPIFLGNPCKLSVVLISKSSFTLRQNFFSSKIELSLNNGILTNVHSSLFLQFFIGPNNTRALVSTLLTSRVTPSFSCNSFLHFHTGCFITLSHHHFGHFSSLCFCKAQMSCELKAEEEAYRHTIIPAEV